MTVAEKWKSIPGYSDYEASNLGRIKSLSRLKETYGGRSYFTKERILTPTEQKGYLKVGMVDDSGVQKRVFVHRAVALAWLANPKSLPLVMHKDDNGLNNEKSNLRWGTDLSNAQDRVSKGRSANRKGSLNTQVKITKKDVLKIRRLYATGSYLQRQLGDEFGISQTQVGRIVRGDRWV